MRGEVEIWGSRPWGREKLLYKGCNMLVDGASELLADIMTISPSLSGIANHATSSLLDSSNFTIQAMSFGTSKKAHQGNAHYLKTDKENYITSALSTIVGDLGIAALIIQDAPIEGSSYSPVVGLPNTPNPAIPVLEKDTNVSATSTDGSLVLSSVFPGNGQLVNFMPWRHASSLAEGTVFSANPAAEFPYAGPYIVGSIYGAFADGSSSPENGGTVAVIGAVPGASTAFFYSSTYPVGQVAESSLTDNLTLSTTYNGYFNEVSSMDVSGFVNMVMSGSPGTTEGYPMSSTASGLCVSGSAEAKPEEGTVEYSLTIAAGDVGMSNLYGGIYQLGLWTIDVSASLLEGNTAPFGFTVLNNPRKYRLFARKDLTQNLAYINDYDDSDVTTPDAGTHNYTDLLIKWRLHFL